MQNLPRLMLTITSVYCVIIAYEGFVEYRAQAEYQRSIQKLDEAQRTPQFCLHVDGEATVEWEPEACDPCTRAGDWNTVQVECTF